MTTRVVVLIGSIAVIVALAGCTEQYIGIKPVPSEACETEACRLAALDGTGPTPGATPTDSVVREYQLALDALDDNCPEPEQQLGRYASEAQAHMAENGVEESLFNILSDVNEWIFFGVDLVDSCKDAFAGYAIVRSS